jgi:uncharacterized membrane protein
VTALFKFSPRHLAQGEFAWSPVVPPMVVAGLLLCALALVAYSVGGLRSLPRRDRIVLGVLRGLAFALLAGCLLRPTLILSRAIPQRNILAIVLDDSRSMRVADVDGERRLAAAQRVFADSSDLVRRLGDRFVLRFFRFSGSASPIESAKRLDASGTVSDLSAALTGVRQELIDFPLAGIVLVSDGADNVGDDFDKPLLALRANKVPVYAIGVGRERFTHDVGVERFDVPPSTLAGGGVSGSVLLSLRDVAGDSVRLSISADGRMVGTATAIAPRGRDAMTVAVRVPSLPVGTHRMRVSALPLRGELLTENNSAEAMLRVRPEGERVLYLEGEPRPEFAFLRRAIAGDSAIRLVGLMQSAKGKFFRLGVDDSLELRDGFPTRRDELFGYRTIVLGSVEASFFSGDQLRMLAEFVSRRGGSVIALGGRGAFAEGGWTGTPLADVLPVAFANGAERLADTAVIEVTVHPTKEGAQHPAIQLGPTATSASRWDSLPQLTVVNRFGALRPGATVLLSGVPASGPDIPVLVLERYGRGTAAVLGVQDSWRWQMSPSLPVEDVTHQTLWRQLLRWMLDQVPDRVEVSVSPEIAAPGQPVAIHARVSDAEYVDLNNAAVSAHVTTPSGAERDIPMEWTLHDDGAYAGQLMADEAGSYQVVVEARHGADTAYSAAAALVADTTGADLGRAELRRDLLQRLATSTGGRYYPLAEASRLLKDVEFTAGGITARDAHDLWDMPIVLLLLVVLLVSDWALRRVRGLA